MSNIHSKRKMSKRTRRHFHKLVQRGREFEKKEKREWISIKDGEPEFEVCTVSPKGRRGRIDIRIEEMNDYVSVVEIKATDWDHILPHRVRPTVLRHARQIWRYIEAELAEKSDVCPGIVYPSVPSDSSRRKTVETAMPEGSSTVPNRATLAPYMSEGPPRASRQTTR